MDDSSSHKEGFVYILTNERSFGRRDWVKIGMTSTSVEQRIRDMETGVPFPFVKFAVLKTANYESIEARVHSLIETISPDLRLNPSREFFKVDPFNAASFLQQVADMMSEPEQVEFFRFMDDGSPDPDFGGHYYECELSGADAIGFPTRDGGFKVLQGSRMGCEVPSFARNGHGYRAMRDRLVGGGVVDPRTMTFLKDHAFRNSAEAAYVVMGRSNITHAWRDIRGNDLAT